jgi:peptidoglycan/xylan/chitin deacetylase (PgdA/CDA1 family)
MALLATTVLPAHAADCGKPVYLTFDTGHMEIAPLVAEVLARQQVRVTFFAANERTKSGDGSLGDDWAPWWKSRAAEGHEFGSHTWDHVYWRADVPGEPPRFRVRPSAGPDEGRDQTWTAAQYCEEIARSAARLQAITGKAPLPLFRAPGGKTSPRLIEQARACGWAHVGWAPAGFLGDELSSESVSNAQLLARALRDVREPLIVGLKERGFCFRTLREHPQYAGWIAQQEGKTR